MHIFPNNKYHKNMPIKACYWISLFTTRCVYVVLLQQWFGPLWCVGSAILFCLFTLLVRRWKRSHFFSTDQTVSAWRPRMKQKNDNKILWWVSSDNLTKKNACCFRYIFDIFCMTSWLWLYIFKNVERIDGRHNIKLQGLGIPYHVCILRI